MIELSRYRALLPVLLVAAAYLLLDVVAAAVAGPAPGFLGPRERRIHWSSVEAAGSRVAAFEALRRRGAAQAVAAFVGFSTVAEGVDPRILDRDDGLDAAWMVLGGDGGSMVRLPEMTRALLASDLVPEVVVLGLHPFFLAGTPAAQKTPRDPRAALRSLFGGDPRGALDRLLAPGWLRVHRKGVRRAFKEALHGLRLRILRGLGLFTDAVYAPDPRPFTPRLLLTHQTIPPDILALQLQMFERWGWYDPRSYETAARSQAAAFRRLVARIRDRGSVVLVVAMPEHSDLRRRVPPEARAAFDRVVSGALVGPGERVLDFRDALPDAIFVDCAHLKARGRRVFSRLFATRFGEILRSDPGLRRLRSALIR